ncbi:Uncharacterised protein [Rikenella microfusus]|uniref:Uncharacterized protein n=1 Tax=Rikenella microfusus TaxID=28139 RepID=A0A379MSU6_9BACT|nr:Uncharacterised protein [Rikenella microfusus]
MISLNGPAVPLGTGDRGFSLLKGVGADRNILKIKCAYDIGSSRIYLPKLIGTIVMQGSVCAGSP